jgi:CDP-glucose 4,6-dehydratase
MDNDDYSNFFSGKNVFITGHTGFKGAWFAKILALFGANVTGYALDNIGYKDMQKANDSCICSVIGDIRDFERLKKAFFEARPEIVFHLAAQPIVRESYLKPKETYDVNVGGTVNILECIRESDTVKSFLNVTTDKVYRNNEWLWGYRENDALDGYDPYSNSKSCSELVTASFKRSFFNEAGVSVSTARAGNVIGGGDFAKDRIIPDCVRNVLASEKISIRSPFSTRPFQYVMEALSAYMLIAKKQYEDIKYSDSYNVGPDESDVISVGELVKIFCECWGNSADFIDISGRQAGAVHEAGILKLDTDKIRNILGWKPKYGINDAIRTTVNCYKKLLEADSNEEVSKIMEEKINEFFM